MKYTEYLDGKVKVWDDLFSLQFRTHAYNFAVGSLYKIAGWADSSNLEDASYRYMHSIYSAEDVDNFGLFNELPKQVISNLENLSLDRAVMNLTTPVDTHWAHTHPVDKVMLYYVNKDWKHEWAGETLFFDETLKSAVLALPYTPGRLIIFDANIPESVKKLS